MLNIAAGFSQSGYNLTRSLRFRASASAYLSRTPSITGNQKTWTLSTWVKRGALGTDGTYHRFFSAQSGTGGARFFIGFEINTDSIGLGQYNGTSYDWSLGTTGLFRDPSNWYHIVLAIDTTQATASNRLNLYVNGVQITAFSSITYPALNSNTYVNTSGNTNRLGSDYNGTALTALSDCYLAETRLIDGQQLTPSSFGEFDTITGVWKAKSYSGAFGTNGGYWPFTDNSALTTSSNVGLGKDFSGNGNYWTTNNISITAGVTYDSMTDVPTLTSATASNYAVLNPLKSGATLSQANLYSVEGAAGSRVTTGTIGMTSGKWYWEVTIGSTGNLIGICNSAISASDGSLTATGNGWGYEFSGVKYPGGTAYGSSYTTNDVIGVAFDADAGTLVFYKNNVSQGTAFTGLTSGPYFAGSGNSTGCSQYYNFGQRPFAYTPPTGFVALNAYNLPTGTILQGNKYMDATLYTGNGSTQTITNAAGFKPDLVWLKSRSFAYGNILEDSVRGALQYLASDSNTAESTLAGSVTSFNSNGFSVGSNAASNTSAYTYVGWQWQAGQGSSSSNTSGTITSTVSVNPSAGFSIVTYTGNGVAGATVGHGLGIKPSFFMVFARNSSQSRLVYSSQITATNYLILNAADASFPASTTFNNTEPTSSVFSLGTSTTCNGSGITYVAYCWSEIAGFSKFDKYTGNGSTDGTFVYTGFTPSLVTIKRIDSTGQWVTKDYQRASNYNPQTGNLYPNLTNAEDTTASVYVDFLSNGFKLRGTYADTNASGGTFIYSAFAQTPSKYSLAR